RGRVRRVGRVGRVTVTVRGPRVFSSFIQHGVLTMALLMMGGGVVPFGEHVARADGARDECLKGSEEGIAARDRGNLRDARKRFVTCAADACPKAMRIDCARWLEDVEASIPTVVFGAKDARGGDIFDVSVYVDGEHITGHE